MNKNSRTAIIIPVYNEGKVVANTVSEVLKKFEHVVCVDDGSRDDSAQQVLKAGATLIRHPINLGQGAAIQTGIEYALRMPDIQYFVTYDSDGQHDLNDVIKMLKVIDEKKVDIVLGSRFLGEARNISRVKLAVLKMAIKFSNKVSGITLTDAHNGLRVFNRHVAEGLNITMPDFAHASEIIERIAEKKYNYIEAPVTIHYSDYSTAKGQSVINAVNIAFDLMLDKVAKR